MNNVKILTVHGVLFMLPALTAPNLRFIPTCLSYSIIWFFINVSFCAICIDSDSCFIRFSPIESTIVFLSCTSSVANWRLRSSNLISFLSSSMFSSSLNFSSFREFFSRFEMLIWAWRSSFSLSDLVFYSSRIYSYFLRSFIKCWSFIRTSFWLTYSYIFYSSNRCS